MPDLDKIRQLGEDDLLGYFKEDLVCRQCSGFCNFRAHVLLDGKPISLCGLKDEVREVLSSGKWDGGSDTNDGRSHG